MHRRLALTLALLAASVISARAGTLTTSLAAFTAGVGGLLNHDSSIGIADGTTVIVVPLASGGILQFVPAVTKDNLTNGAPLPPLADGYTGDVFEAISPSVTVTFSGYALGFTVYTGSTNFLGVTSYLTFVSSSDGQNALVDIPTYDPAGGGAVGQFVGYFGGGATSITVSSTDPNLFTIAEIVDAPEPATLAVLAAGLLGLGLARRARG